MATTVLLLKVVLSLLVVSTQALVQLPDLLPQTVPFNNHLGIGSDDLPMFGAPLVRTVTGIDPDQLHITPFGEGQVLFSWVTGEGQVGLGVVSPRIGSIRSQVFLGTEPGNYTTTVEGNSTTYYMDYSKADGALSYASPLIHHVLVKGLKPGTMYYYQVGDASFQALSREWRLRVTASPTVANLPFTIAILGDTGQTYNTSVTLNHTLAGNRSDLIILCGDFVYADAWQSTGRRVANYCGPQGNSRCSLNSYQPKWDSWARMFEPLLATTPFLHTHGNHELESDSLGQKQVAYNARYPLPVTVNGQIAFSTAPNSRDANGSATNNMYYSVNVPGAHIVFLSGYIKDDVFAPTSAQVQPLWALYKSVTGTPMSNGVRGCVPLPAPMLHYKRLEDDVEEQKDHSRPPWLVVLTLDGPAPTIGYKWLVADLQRLDRTKLPWLIVVFHAPWYSTYVSHYLEAEAMRQAYEPLLYKFGTDLVFSGHVHAYSRTKPVYNNTLDKCGAVHIVIGDAGNVEGLAASFIDIHNEPYCSAPFERSWPSYQPQRAFPPGTTATGSYCYTRVPSWVAYREPSFGHGTLTIVNATTAEWSWNRDQDSALVQADSVTWKRDGGCVPKKVPGGGKAPKSRKLCQRGG